MAEIPIQRKEGRNIWPILLGLLVLLALLWFLFGRNRNDGAVATTDTTAAATTTAANGAAGTDSGAMMAGGAAGTAGAMAGSSDRSSPVAASAAKMTDPEIFSMVAAVNQGEVDAGNLARTKAASANVKAYATEMVNVHTNMTKQGAALASALGEIPKPNAQDSIVINNNAMASTLRSTASGAAFDQAYIDGQVRAHQHALTFLQHAQTEAQNADLKKMITGAIPEVQQHLERARSLRAQ
jgi:putative membrane protein